ncbi:MAG: Glutamate--tRNA ligase [Eubacteriales bacterium SKADARSKE-1]|nr:Glutamate--tRNA ligase [Eubacteriales bacterium SKADARSKE-1]
MTNKAVRTRFAPSPTGFMHIGNLRTALYEYLIAKSNNGAFVLRIEDTDRERYVEGAVDIIYNTLKTVGLKYDEGPDIGGPFGPYVQSERCNSYKEFAERLVREGKAYYCFCPKERLESLKDNKDSNVNAFIGYDRHCRDLSKDEVDRLLKENTPYVIRQKAPLTGETTFNDSVYGKITVQNNEIEDQVLIKADGFPTYNFANVIDDHMMNITHVVRGSEYLSSTPKYNLLYEAFNWETPTYVHLPLIVGKNPDGTTSKLSKRHGATSFDDLVTAGYLPEAIINYIALLGWCPKENREVFTLDELVKVFSIDGISKSPAIFDYDKLNWFNAEYIRSKTLSEFTILATPYFKEILKEKILDYSKLAAILQQRVTTLNQIPDMIKFFNVLPDYDNEIFINKKSKTNLENSCLVLQNVIPELKSLTVWDHDNIYNRLVSLAEKLSLKNGTVMWPVRIAVSSLSVTPGGAIEILEILGKEESLKRLEIGLDKLSSN